jgi:aerobic carbon-monoxide dehydrogenase small subunit
MTERRAITLVINGKHCEVTAEPRRTLVDVTRHDCGQTGTHIGCEHGVCSACKVRSRGCLSAAVCNRQVKRS